MNEKTLEALSFFRIRDEIRGFCLTEEGASFIDNRLPFGCAPDEVASLERAKNLGRNWETFFRSNKSSPLQSWLPITPYFPVLAVSGATLSQEGLFSFLQFTTSALKTADILSSSKTTLHTTVLSNLAEKIPYPEIKTVWSLVARVIDSSGEVKDLPELREIKTRISKLQNEISNVLKKFTKNQSYQNFLESTVPVFRGERQVLAVKAQYKNRISGIVSGMSQSGMTLYIEPDEAVRKNNELIEEEFNLEQETKKVFQELTEKISGFLDELKTALEIMKELDATSAIAKWGMEKKCVWANNTSTGLSKLRSDAIVETSPTEVPQLLQARHPLLGKSAVPLDIKFLDEKKVLIVTGPNTGGKTVALKTYALLAMLNQAGFPIPADEGSALPFYDDFYCDIGDEQSIDSSLSTFSSHMKNISDAVSNATENSLVLLDELGSGTDPHEGCAIAMAVLDKLIEKKATVLATTHHGLLKNYAHTNSSCINASMEFDSATLRPTYKILMGVPGESHALEIAEKSGLPVKIIEAAKSYIDGKQTDVTVLIKNLTEKYAELAEKDKIFEEKQHYIDRREKKLSESLNNIKKRELEVKRNELDKKERFLKESRKKLENLVRTIREGEITREKTLAVKNFVEEFQEKIENSKNDLEGREKNIKKAKAAATNASNATSDFQVGSIVLAGHSKSNATLLEKLKNGKWLVQAGSVKMQFPEEDLILVSATQKKMKATVTVELDETDYGENSIFKKTPSSKESALYELRILGMRWDDAKKTLEKQLDLCALENFKNFSIIHGKGTGILQQNVQDFLSHYPTVKEFHFAAPEDGGFGKTYVTLM